MTPEDRLHSSIERLVREHPLDPSLVSRVSSQLPARGRRHENRWLLYGTTALASATILVLAIVALNLVPAGGLPIGPAPTVDATPTAPRPEPTPSSTPPQGGIEAFVAYRRHEEQRDPSLDRDAILVIAHAEIRPGLVMFIADYEGDAERFVLMSWRNDEWHVAGQGAPDLLAFRDEPEVYAQVIGAEVGLSEEWLAIYGPLPNGPIGQIELELNGTPEMRLIDGDGAFLLLLPADLTVGPRYRFFDLGTHVLGEGEIDFK